MRWRFDDACAIGSAGLGRRLGRPAPLLGPVRARRGRASPLLVRALRGRDAHSATRRGVRRAGADSQTAPCTSPLPALTPGEHTLEMATRLTRDGNVIESARSAPVLYTAGASGFGSETAGARTPSSQGDVAALPRYVVEPVVGGLDEPSALAQLPDGRLLIAERGGRIRLAEGGVLRPEPAAELPGADPAAGARVSLAVAPDFEASRHVFVSYARLDADGTRTGRVVRLREVGGSLGEPAVIVDDLPAEPDAPGLRIGRDRTLYVATSAAAGQDAPTWVRMRARSCGSNLMVARLPPIRTAHPRCSRSATGADSISTGSRQARTSGTSKPMVTRLILGRSEAGRPAVPVADLGEARAAGVAFYAGGTFAEWQGSLFVAVPGQECLLRVSGLEASPPQPARGATGARRRPRAGRAARCRRPLRRGRGHRTGRRRSANRRGLPHPPQHPG